MKNELFWLLFYVQIISPLPRSTGFLEDELLDPVVDENGEEILWVE